MNPSKKKRATHDAASCGWQSSDLPCPRTATRGGIVIFDIDQTLVHAFKAHDEATAAVLRKVFGIEGHLPDVDYEGQTVHHNLAAIASRHDVPIDVIRTRIDVAVSLYDAAFDSALRRLTISKDAKLAIPHAIGAVMHAKQAGNVLCVVTGGNPHVGKKLLAAIGIDHLFDVMVFGTESDDRANLVARAIAMGKAKAKAIGMGYVSRSRIVSIGDSVRDIQAAHANGIIVVSVLTGSTSSTTLKKHKPDYIVKDLSDPIVDSVVGYVG